MRKILNVMGLIETIGYFFKHPIKSIAENSEIYRKLKKDYISLEGKYGLLDKSFESYLDTLNKKEGLIKGLELKVGELTNLCLQQGQAISGLRKQARQRDKEEINFYDEFIVSQAEQSPLSYIVVKGATRILASTEPFRTTFGFSPENLHNRPYHSAIKIPEGTPDYNIANIKEIFRDKNKIEKQITIINGNGEEKIISFEKEVPIHIKNYDSFTGRNTDCFYTLVYIYEVGAVKRVFGEVVRRLHLQKTPTTIAEMITQQKIKKIKKESDEKKDEILNKSNKF